MKIGCPTCQTHGTAFELLMIDGELIARCIASGHRFTVAELVQAANRAVLGA